VTSEGNDRNEAGEANGSPGGQSDGHATGDGRSNPEETGQPGPEWRANIPEGFGDPGVADVVPTSNFVAEPEDSDAAGQVRLTRAQVQAQARGGRSDDDSPADVDDGWEDRTVFRHHPWRVVALVFVVLGLGFVVGGTLWVNHEANPSGPKGAQVVVTVPRGSGTSQFAGVLASKGVIGSSLAYRIWSNVHAAPAIYAGAYAFNKNDSFSDIDRVLGAGPNVFAINVPAGFTVGEVAERVGQYPGFDATTFATLATSGTVHSPWQPVGVTSLEGLLGTGTYQLVPGETETELLTDMIDRFDQQANAMDLTAGAAAIGLTPYQAITMASIVEKEGFIQKNMGQVARVILNRLAKNMPLQMDSTVLYSEGRDGGRVTTADEAVKSPYNTYLNAGLTPTPICFPSAAALKATLSPTPGSWLYFVVVESDGTEAFATTYAEQQANEAVAAQRGLS